ncbi:hypothetical protein Tco_1380362, partial [Tanacetum coccineum]
MVECDDSLMRVVGLVLLWAESLGLVREWAMRLVMGLFVECLKQLRLKGEGAASILRKWYEGGAFGDIGILDGLWGSRGPHKMQILIGVQMGHKHWVGDVFEEARPKYPNHLLELQRQDVGSGIEQGWADRLWSRPSVAAEDEKDWRRSLLRNLFREERYSEKLGRDRGIL